MDPNSLTGKKGLIVGIANDKSIGYGCARQFVARGAEVAITYFNEKAEAYVRPLAEELGASIIVPCNVMTPGSLESVFDAIREKWGKLDFLLHAVANAQKEDLRGRFVDCSEEGFAYAMSVSCHSFVRMARLAEPLMKDGGTLLTLTFSGSERVVKGYGLMGPVKAALESSVKYLAAELAPKNIRVNALSPGPIQTRAASGIPGFDELLEEIVARSLTGRPVTTDDVGHAASWLVSDAAASTTGCIQFVDGGFHQSG